MCLQHGECGVGVTGGTEWAGSGGLAELAEEFKFYSKCSRKAWKAADPCFVGPETENLGLSC